MNKICNKCHKDHKNKCPKPTMAQVLNRNAQIVEQVERAEELTQNSTLHFGEFHFGARDDSDGHPVYKEKIMDATGKKELVAELNNKLFKVVIRGGYKGFYVVASDPTSAYAKVKEWLDEKDYGFTAGRALKSIELLAEEYEYTDTETMLFL